ncbi:MAG: PTS sugar transporter subunit IIB [Oscillospiraceae bacterium]|nr:PTS sugar transporter subunit IIB [Oscillospiraceae bacterium]
MREPTLIRVDFRLLHGMVATKWVRSLNIVNIYIIDDGVYADEFLRQVFDLAKPAGTKLEFFTVEQAAAKWTEGGFEEDPKEPSLVLIKNVDSAKRLYDAGMKFSKLLIGNSEPDRKKKQKHFNNVYYFDDDDARTINSMADAGVEITLQEQQGTKSTTWAKVREKYFSKV